MDDKVWAIFWELERRFDSGELSQDEKAQLLPLIEKTIARCEREASLKSRAVIAKPENLNGIMDYGRRAHENQSKGQNDLFASKDGPPPIELEDTEPWTELEMLEAERNAVGLYLSGHPLDDFYDYLDDATELNEIKRQNDLKYGSHLMNRPKEMRGAKRNGRYR